MRACFLCSSARLALTRKVIEDSTSGDALSEDCLKIRFIREAVADPDPFKRAPFIDPEIKEVIDWMSGKTTEQLAESIKGAGLCGTWLNGTDCVTQQAIPCLVFLSFPGCAFAILCRPSAMQMAPCCYISQNRSNTTTCGAWICCERGVPW